MFTFLPYFFYCWWHVIDRYDKLFKVLFSDWIDTVSENWTVSLHMNVTFHLQSRHFHFYLSFPDIFSEKLFLLIWLHSLSISCCDILQQRKTMRVFQYHLKKKKHKQQQQKKPITTLFYSLETILYQIIFYLIVYVCIPVIWYENSS